MPKPRSAVAALMVLTAATLMTSACTKPVSAPQPAATSQPATQVATPSAEATSQLSQTTSAPPVSAEASKQVTPPAKPKVPSTSSMKASLSAAALEESAIQMDGQNTPYKIVRVNVAVDGKGAWWGHVVTLPKGAEQLDFWAKYVDGTWKLTAQDVEPPPPSTFFPASVISKLDL